MTSRFRWLGVLAIVGLLPTAALAQQATRFAVIDVQRVLTESKAGKASYDKLKAVRDKKVQDGKAKEQELRDLEKKISDQKFSLSEDKLNELQRDYQQKAIAFKRFQDDADRELDDAQKKELHELEKKIMPVIDQLGKDRGYTMIFNKFQSGLVYADDSVDITDEVIKRFDDAALTGAAAAPAPAKGGGQ